MALDALSPERGVNVRFWLHWSGRSDVSTRAPRQIHEPEETENAGLQGNIGVFWKLRHLSSACYGRFREYYDPNL